jgi:hypothetical protein
LFVELVKRRVSMKSSMLFSEDREDDAAASLEEVDEIMQFSIPLSEDV